MVDGDIVTSGRSYRIFLCFICGASHISTIQKIWWYSARWQQGWRIFVNSRGVELAGQTLVNYYTPLVVLWWIVLPYYTSRTWLMHYEINWFLPGGAPILFLRWAAADLPILGRCPPRRNRATLHHQTHAACSLTPWLRSGWLGLSSPLG